MRLKYKQMLHILSNCAVLTLQISITWCSHLVLKSQQHGTTSLFSFAMVKRNVPAECVYTFIIISSAICIITPNKAIYQGCLPRTTWLICPHRQTFRNKMAPGKAKLNVRVKSVMCAFCHTFLSVHLVLSGMAFSLQRQHQHWDDTFIRFIISRLFTCAPKWSNCKMH